MEEVIRKKTSWKMGCLPHLFFSMKEDYNNENLNTLRRDYGRGKDNKI